MADDLELWVGQALDELIDLEPSMMMLSPDLLVHVPTLSNGAFLTHRLTESELSGGWVATGADLAPLLLRSDELLMADGSEILYDDLGGGQGILEGPDGWLEHFLPGTMVGFRIDGDILSLESLEDPAPPTASIVEAARAAYDREVREPWLPVRADEIVAGMLLDHPGILATPTVPISELLALRRSRAAWSGVRRTKNRFGEKLTGTHKGIASTTAFPTPTVDAWPDEFSISSTPRIATPQEMREALSALRDPGFLSVLTDELLDLDNDDAQLGEISEIRERPSFVSSARSQKALQPDSSWPWSVNGDAIRWLDRLTSS